MELQMLKINLWLSRNKGRGINWEIGFDIHLLLCIKYVINKETLYNTGNYTQYFIMVYMGKQSGKDGLYVYG